MWIEDVATVFAPDAKLPNSPARTLQANDGVDEDAIFPLEKLRRIINNHVGIIDWPTISTSRR